jgi:scyllo-inositol 2-dehydrogenase (NADP+)
MTTEGKTRVALIGVGKMGLSHLAILNAHPDVTVAAVCDRSGYLLDVLGKYGGFNCYSDYDEMLTAEKLDAVLVATPTKFHAPMVEKALQRGLHVFCEKPFVLDPAEGEPLVRVAEEKALVNQVGYVNRFVPSFEEAARVVRSGALGRVHHVRAEAYGPVVLKPTGSTWRSTASEGGGALYDYACHALDLVNFVVGAPESVSGVLMASVFSKGVEDEVYCTLHFPGGASGQLAVNWSDESQRKASTKVSVWGTNGQVVVDRQECRIYLREQHLGLPDVRKGWTIRYATDLTPPVAYYLRGEDYTGQVDAFIRAIRDSRAPRLSTFRSALETDRVMQMIRTGPAQAPSVVRPAPAVGWLARLFGRRTSV